MSDMRSHHGVLYSVTNVGKSRWKWQIFPPISVQGLFEEGGEAQGDRANAVFAAKIAIERQTGHLFGKSSLASGQHNKDSTD